jgi:hypothetical protein
LTSEVDRPSLVFNDFNIPAFTPGRHRVEPTLDLSQNTVEVEVEVEVNLRPTVSRPVCPGVRHPSGTCDQFFFRHETSCRQLRLWYFVVPSLTRGRVCNLLLNCFWALPEQSLLSRSPAELKVHILLSHLRLGGPGSRIYIPQGTGWSSYMNWVPFLSPLTTHGEYDEVFYLPPHGVRT